MDRSRKLALMLDIVMLALTIADIVIGLRKK